MIGFHEGTLKFPNRNSFPYEILMVAPMTSLVPVAEDEVDHFSVWFKELSGYINYISVELTRQQAYIAYDSFANASPNWKLQENLNSSIHPVLSKVLNIAFLAGLLESFNKFLLFSKGQLS